MSVKKYITVGLAACLSVAAALPASARNTEVWSGFSAAQDSSYGFLGGVVAIDNNMHLGDIERDNFLLRAGVGYGQFKYDRPRNPAGGVQDDMTNVEMMVGYQHFFADQRESIDYGRFTFYIGGDYQSHDLSKPDRNNRVRGDKAGVMGQTELNLTFAKHFELSGIGSYATDNSTYWSRLRVGYKFGQFSAGPEGVLQGSSAYDQQRIGGYVNIPLGNAISADADLGYSNSARRGRDGMYGGAGLSFKF